MIKSKRVYDKAATSDGYRVLVDRLWPRGMKKEQAKVDLWLKDIAPSDELRKSFHRESLQWPDFEKRYQAELKKKGDLIADLKKLEKMHGTVTLLFGSRDVQNNQAVVLEKLLKKR